MLVHIHFKPPAFSRVILAFFFARNEKKKSAGAPLSEPRAHSGSPHPWRPHPITSLAEGQSSVKLGPGASDSGKEDTRLPPQQPRRMQRMGQRSKTARQMKALCQGAGPAGDRGVLADLCSMRAAFQAGRPLSNSEERKSFSQVLPDSSRPFSKLCPLVH